MSFIAQPAYGNDGYEVPPMRQNRTPAPAPGTQHQWVCTALYTVSQEAVERSVATWMNGGRDDGIHLDHENLTSILGPVCLKCAVELNPTTYARPCPVNVTYIHDPNCRHQH